MANNQITKDIGPRGINMKKILTNSIVAVFALMSVVFCNHSAWAINEYYEPSGAPAAGSALSSSVIREEFVSVGSMAVKLPVLAGNGGEPVFINSGGTALESKSIADTNTALGTELTSRKDATGGYAGLTLFKINFKNALNTITSFFTNANTVARTYTFQDRDGTIADNTDLAAKADLASPTLTGVPAAPTAATSTDTTQIATTEFVQNVFTDLGGGLGVGQTWQPTDTRSAAVTYQNTTGKTIAMRVLVIGTSGNGSLKVGTDSPPTQVVDDGTGRLYAIIPNNQYYRLDLTGDLIKTSWRELR